MKVILLVKDYGLGNLASLPSFALDLATHDRVWLEIGLDLWQSGAHGVFHGRLSLGYLLLLLLFLVIEEHLL